MKIKFWLQFRRKMALENKGTNIKEAECRDMIEFK